MCVHTDQEPKPVSRTCGASPQFTSIIAHFDYHTEITLQDVPNREYTLRLFVGNVESELQRKNNHTWTPAQRQYVPYFPNTSAHQWMRIYREVPPTSSIRAEVRMSSGHSFWAKHRESNEYIELRGLFSDYWSSNNREFTVLSQSITTNLVRTDLIEKGRGCCHWKAQWLSRSTTICQ